MARLVFITNGLSGGLNASLELARRLTNAGHEVHFVGHRDLASQIESHGLAYHRLVADDLALGALQQAIARSGRLWSLPRARALRHDFVTSSEVATVVSALDADALIIDVEAHYAVLATRSLGLPTLLKSDWYSMSRRWGLPPLHSDLPLPTTWREKRIADLAWARALAERLADNTVGQLHPTRLMRRYAPFRYDTISRHDLKAVAKARGLGLRSLTSQTNWLRPHTYQAIPMITATASELDFGAETDPHVHSVGPLVRRDRADTIVSADDQARWAAFRDQNAATDRPLLYCAFGTMLADTDALANKIAAAVAQRPEWDLVVGRGGLASGQPISTPPNVLVLDYAPQAQVLASADLAITHAGINTVTECLVFGVPALVHPAGDTDQGGIAARMKHHGVATPVRLGDLDTDAVATLIEQSLSDQALTNRVTNMQETVLAYERNQVAEHVVERLLKGAL